MNNKDKVLGILWAAAVICCIILAVRYLWPIILVVILIAAALGWRTHHIVKEAEKQARQSMEDETENNDWQQDLFKAQAEKKKDVIDAEFTEHDDDSSSQHSQQ